MAHIRLSRGLGLVVGIAMLAIAIDAMRAHAQTTPARPATQPALKNGWEEIDQRLVFLTVQLSTVESSIDATTKSLKLAGYKQAAQLEAADAARRGNEAMDRKGGGPVSWQVFYGTTAEKFFYHPRDGATVHVNPSPAAQRPPQFDYIYRANEQNRARAEAEAAKLGNKIDELLAYRKQLEAEQTALWCKIAFRGVASRDFSARPLYRLDLAGGAADDAGRQSLEASRAAVAFLRAVDAELIAVSKSFDENPREALDHLLQATTAARAEMQGKLFRLTALAGAVADPRSSIGQFTRLAKRLEDAAQNLVDAHRLGADCDTRDDHAGKRSYRGQFQQMAFDYASTVLAADQALARAADDWKIVVVAKTAETTQPVKPVTPDSIPVRLDAAKAAHGVELANAKRALVAAIDARLNAAADSGDLAAVQALQPAKIKAAQNGTLPDDLKDAAVLAAKKQMDDTIQAANARLAAAYRETVSSYTKARQFTEAQAVQEEFNATGLNVGGTTAPRETTTTKTPGADPVIPTSADGSFPPPKLGAGKTQVDLPAPIDAVVVGGSGRYLVLHLKKLQQLAVFDVSTLKVLKYIPLPSADVVYAASAKKLFVGIKDLRRLQRWDLATQQLELTIPAPEGGIGAIAAGAGATGPVIMLGDNSKRFWLVNPGTLKAEHYPSKNWGTDGSAGGPCNIHVSFDGSTVVACGGGWAGIELSNLNGMKVVNLEAGSYVHGDTLVSGNGALVFPNDGGIIRNDLKSVVKGIEGYPFPAHDLAFSLAFNKDRHRNSSSKPALTLYSNADPRPLVTLRDLPELAKDSKLPVWQRVNLIPRAKVLVTVGDGGDSLLFRKFDLSEALEAEGIDYLFVESAPVCNVNKGARYLYKMQIRSKKGGVKCELQAGPKGMTLTKDGTVSWTAPMRADAPAETVIIQITDSAGQTIFHSFAINLNDVTLRR